MAVRRRVLIGLLVALSAVALAVTATAASPAAEPGDDHAAVAALAPRTATPPDAGQARHAPALPPDRPSVVAAAVLALVACSLVRRCPGVDAAAGWRALLVGAPPVAA